jgi:hypothetical protein
MKHNTSSLLLHAGFLSLVTTEAAELTGTLIDPAARKLVTTDGESIAIHPMPADWKLEAPPLFLATVSGKDQRSLNLAASGVLEDDDGTPVPPAAGYIDYAQIEAAAVSAPVAYHVTLDARRLLALAEALGDDEILLRIPATTDLPITVTPANPEGPDHIVGYFTPLAGEGLVAKVEVSGATTKPDAPPSAAVARLEKHEKTGNLIVRFDGKPAKEVREVLKDPALGFRWSGSGTKRGIPAEVWYGPDNPYTRERLSELPGVALVA